MKNDDLFFTQTTTITTAHPSKSSQLQTINKVQKLKN